MDDVRGRILGLPTVVTTNKIKVRSFKSSESTQKKECAPDRSVSENQFFSGTLNERNLSLG